jgi:hypothetical protein
VNHLAGLSAKENDKLKFIGHLLATLPRLFDPAQLLLPTYQLVQARRSSLNFRVMYYRVELGAKTTSS